MNNGIYGAVIGDIVGSYYEFLKPRMKDKDFPLFSSNSRFTDDTVMSVALAATIIAGFSDEKSFKKLFIEYMHYFGLKHFNAGYGGFFKEWLVNKSYEPYGSYGNGSAMRVAAAGAAFDSLEETQKVARWSAEVTHNHPEGIKGAESVASIMWLARNGYDKDYIRKYISEKYDYDLNRTCDDIRPSYKFEVSCQKSVPEAIIAFLDGNSYEECIRLAVSLGGDTDTQAAITGAMASMMYPIPEDIKKQTVKFISDDLLIIINNFSSLCN